MPTVGFTVRDPFMVAAARSGRKMRVLLMFAVCLLQLGPSSSAKAGSSLQAMYSSSFLAVAPWAPISSPAFPPQYRSHVASPANARMPHLVSPLSSPPPQESCEGLTCSDPLTRTPILSPCGCVFPIKVIIDVGVAPILLFPQMGVLEVEVAAGTFLKQSQVRIMGADASFRSQDMTRVTIYLVPLGQEFDKMTALLIYDRFWDKKVRISSTNFGDYEVISVSYPGLPSSPPPMLRGSSNISPSESQQYPFTANVPADRKQEKNSRIIILVSLSSFLLVLVCVGIVLVIFKLKGLEKKPSATGSAGVSSMTKRCGVKTMIPRGAASSPSLSFASTMVTCHSSVKTFLVAELDKATGGFSSERILGEGGFGCVYHGVMEDGNEVAVKLITREVQNGDREFIGEIEILSRLHHRNLVKLIGICIEGHMRCLVYELVRNGSVESHLHGTDRHTRQLNWDARMKIALGAARALAYLHEDSNPRVIHRDFKSSNVLLEEDFTPKVSDFGLAREASDASQHISTRVMGTFGYVAPEYAMTGHLLVKSDVYSYGVVLLELLTGRKPVYLSHDHEPENLVTWARPLLTTREGLEQLIDPFLRGSCEFDVFARVAAVASMCVHVEASQRPFMGEVVQAFKLIYNDMDETNEDSCSQRGSSSCHDFDDKGEFRFDSSLWSGGGSPRWNYGNAYSLVSMEYSSEPIESTHRARSTLAEHIEWDAGFNGSGSLRRKRKKSALHRLRSTRSEHGFAKGSCIWMSDHGL